METNVDWLLEKVGTPGQGDSKTSDQKIREVLQTEDQVLDKNETPFEKFDLVNHKPGQMPK